MTLRIRPLTITALTAALHLGCADGDGSFAGAADGNAAGAGGACEPMTCEDLDATCGELDDGCGKAIECGRACAAGGQGGGAGGSVEQCSSPVVASTPRTARRARSSGFSGTDEQYTELYGVSCEDISDCAMACSERGGAEAMCEASECLPNAMGESDCLPAPVWTNLAAIQFENASVFDMTQIILVNGAYRDVLVADELSLEIPMGGRIEGIVVEVLRAGDESIADDSVRIVRRGSIGTAERALPQTWLDEPAWVAYGSPDDLWGETWSPADVNSDDFGVALSAAYTSTAGNTRAYVDQVRVTVHYRLCD